MAEDMTYMSGWKLIKSNTLLQLYISIVKPFKQTYISFTQQHEEKQDMAVSDAIVSAVVERLGDLLINEAKFLSGVRAQVEDAQTKLEFMRCFLRDADAQGRDGNEAVRLWVVKVRDTSYDLEDVIETYIFKVASDRHGRGIISVLKGSACIFSKAIELHRAGSKLENISSRISDLRSNLDMFNSDRIIKKDDNDIQQQRKLRRTYSHVVESDVVGFDKDIEELVALLTAEKSFQSPRVISVFGMGGLGKTTVARKVYQHPQVRSHFDCCAWASISQQCNTRDVLERILFALNPPTKERREEIKITSDDELAKQLHNFQNEKKCLVVLDDIWTTTTWDVLQHAFPRGDTESKIMLTTRVESIATHVDRNCYIHKPTFLNDNQSWELFQNKCLGKDPTGSEDNERKKEIGQEMLKYCGGLPLAIIVLSGLLSTKETINEWEVVKKNVMMYISKGGTHDGSEYHGVSWVLSLSYDELPIYLKPCFLYLSSYPEDAPIQVKELCLMLTAEGFISPRRHSSETVEDVAYDYLSELVERSMVQVESWGLTGRMKTLRIHDLMRDLCVSKAQEENFLHFIDLRNEAEEPLKPVSTVARRVSIYSYGYFGDDFFRFIDNKNGSLRCLTVDGGGTTQQLLRQVFNRFFMLRVLNLRFSGCYLKLPKEIGKLIHLRLFSTTLVENIPSSIGNLRCLQTLLVKSYDDNVKVPNVMWKLEQLRHLSLPYFHGISASSKWLRLPNLRNLQTLTLVQMKYLDRNDFLQLTNLKKLAIKVDRNLERIFQDPTTVTFLRLRHLQIDCGEERVRVDIVPMILSYPQIYKLKVKGRIVKLPEYNQFSPNLVKLKLEVTCLKDDPMPTLEKLSSLRVLFFCNSYEGNEMVCSKGGFPQLESLQIRYLENLEEWKVEEGALSTLRFLLIRGCFSLRSVPEGLRYVTTLKEMNIIYMRREFEERVKEGGDDFYKVHHVPSLLIVSDSNWNE